MSQGVLAVVYWLQGQSLAVDWARGGGDPRAGGGEPVGWHRGGVGHRGGRVPVERSWGGVRGDVHGGRLVVDVGHVGRGLVGGVGPVGRVGLGDVRVVATVVVTPVETRGNSYWSRGTVQVW